jgi:hypothetical protein
MALNDITIVKGSGGLGRPLEGTDYVSGLLFYSATLPSGFSANDRIKTVFSVQDAEGYGILDTHVGETQAVANILLTGSASAGDQIEISYLGIDGTVVVLPYYTLSVSDATSLTTAALALVGAINAQTVNTGFTAAAMGANVIVTTKGGEGVFPNSGTPYSCSIITSGMLSSTVTQPLGTGNTVLGVASQNDIMHYHVSEYFRMQPKGKLYIGVYATADYGTFNSITLMQNYAQGEIKQLAVYENHTAFTTAATNGIQSVLNTLETNHKTISSVILGAEISATADISTITSNLHTLSNKNVSVTIAQDGANVGYHLFKATGKSITNAGQVLGSISLAKVNESIAWFGKFQVATTELDTLAFANGQLYTSVSDGTITSLDSYGYLLLRKVTDLNGSFHNRPYTCISITSDYAFIYSNRTIDKAIRNMRATVLPSLGINVKVNVDGTLTEDAINYFKSLAEQGMDNLQRANEISNYAVIIDPAQDVLATSTLVITVQIQPTGVADFITINVGFTTQIS